MQLPELLENLENSELEEILYSRYLSTSLQIKKNLTELTKWAKTIPHPDVNPATIAALQEDLATLQEMSNILDDKTIHQQTAILTKITNDMIQKLKL